MAFCLGGFLNDGSLQGGLVKNMRILTINKWGFHGIEWFYVLMLCEESKNHWICFLWHPWDKLWIGNHGSHGYFDEILEDHPADPPASNQSKFMFVSCHNPLGGEHETYQMAYHMLFLNHSNLCYFWIYHVSRVMSQCWRCFETTTSHIPNTNRSYWIRVYPHESSQVLLWPTIVM